MSKQPWKGALSKCELNLRSDAGYKLAQAVQVGLATLKKVMAACRKIKGQAYSVVLVVAYDSPDPRDAQRRALACPQPESRRTFGSHLSPKLSPSGEAPPRKKEQHARLTSAKGRSCSKEAVTE